MNKKTYQFKTKPLKFFFRLFALSLCLCANLYAKTSQDTFSIGGCLAVNYSLSLANNDLEPLGWVENAIGRFDNKHRQLWLKAARDSTASPVLFPNSLSIKILQYPKNGKLIIKGEQLMTQASKNPARFYYVANENYLGKDKVIYLIEDEEYKIKYVQNLVVIENVGDYSSEENCMDTGIEYLISQPRNPVPIPEQALMKRDISVPNFYNKDKQIKFIKNQIIDYIKESNGNLLLVGSYGEKIAWMPLSAVITANEFTKLEHWQGKAKVSYCSDSICEGKGVSLKFKVDGTFYDESYPKDKGRLYYYQDLIWARNGKERRFDLQLFKKFKNNHLCAILSSGWSGIDKSEAEISLMSATVDDGIVKGCI